MEADMNDSNARAYHDDGDEPHPLVARFASTSSGEVTQAFEVPVHAAGGLGVATIALARKLAWLANEGGQHNVFLSTPRLRWYYTQCVVDPADGIWIEAVSNEFIVPVEDKLTSEQEELLAGLGFNEPDEDGSPNHWCVLAAPVDWVEAAALLTAPLVTVYGLTELDELVVEICPHWRRA
jgi:hypothetical protein